MRHSSHRFGTRTTGGLDPASLREGLASPGMDTRFWESLGTVGTIDDSGEPNYSDPHSVWIGPEGVECDVILQPLMQRVTALWGFGGEIADIAPIHPGDQVLVACPNGDLMTPVITTIIHSRANKQPMTAGVPIFDNKRRLIYARKGSIDIRTADTTQILMDPAGTVTTTAKRVNQGDASASEQEVLGTSYRRDEDKMIQDLIVAFGELATASVGPLAGLATGFGDVVKALTTFQTSAQTNNGYLSDTVFLKK